MTLKTLKIEFNLWLSTLMMATFLRLKICQHELPVETMNTEKIPSNRRAETFRYMCKVIDGQSKEAKLARCKAVLDRFPHASRTEAGEGH